MYFKCGTYITIEACKTAAVETKKWEIIVKYEGLGVLGQRGDLWWNNLRGIYLSTHSSNKLIQRNPSLRNLNSPHTH